MKNMNWAKHEKQMRLSLAIMSRSNGNWTEWSTIQGVIERVLGHKVQLPINRIHNKMRKCIIYVNLRE